MSVADLLDCRHCDRRYSPLPVDTPEERRLSLPIDAPNVGLGLAAGRIEAAAPHPSDTGDMYVAAGVPVMRLFLAFVICLLAAIGNSHGASVTSPLNVTVVPPSPTVTNFTIDPDPSKGGARGDVLEKTVDYFTDPSHTNRSVIVGYGTYPSGSGGLWLYTNDGSATGQWTRTPIPLLRQLL